MPGYQMTLIIESGGLTDVGKKRKLNEDSLFVDDDMGLFIVADGMGGHQAGEVASLLVVNSMKEYLGRLGPERQEDELEDYDPSLSQEANRLMASIMLANSGVHEVAGKNKAYHGMGSTVSAVVFTKDSFVAANVGDSPIFLIQHGEMEEVSMPHTVIAEQAAIDPEAAEQLGDKFAHMLTRAMGVEETVEPDVCEVQCFPGDTLVIASDGLTNMVPEEEIMYVVQNHRPAKACKILVDLANQSGGEDNITVIVLRVKKVLNDNQIFSGFFSRIYKGLQKLRTI